MENNGRAEILNRRAPSKACVCQFDPLDPWVTAAIHEHDQADTPECLVALNLPRVFRMLVRFILPDAAVRYLQNCELKPSSTPLYPFEFQGTVATMMGLATDANGDLYVTGYVQSNPKDVCVFGTGFWDFPRM